MELTKENVCLDIKNQEYKALVTHLALQLIKERSQGDSTKDDIEIIKYEMLCVLSCKNLPVAQRCIIEGIMNSTGSIQTIVNEVVNI